MASAGKITKSSVVESKEIVKAFDEITIAIRGSVTALAELKTAADGIKNFEKLTTVSAASSKEITNLNTQIKTLQTQIKKLEQDITKLNTTKKKESKATKEQTRLEKANATAKAKHKARTSELNKETQKLNAQTNAYNASLRRQATGGKGLLKSLKSLTMSLRNLAIAYLGFQTLMRGFKDIFQVTKILDSITFAQEKVIKSQVEFAQTQKWLSRIISDYGLDLVTVTNRYTKFRAATISSNLSAIQTQKIFGSMSKAAATLGLNTEELQGVYLALEQMISKNKVTTEELRRQLGERLPGAFDIMAKSMKVSTNELNKMIRAGKVMSEEVLPNFAIAVEKAYGIESVKFVDTLIAAQNRLRTAWIGLIRIFDAAESIKGFLNTIAGFIDWIGRNIKTVGQLTKAIFLLLGAFASWKIASISMIVLKKLKVKWTAAEITVTKASTIANKKAAAAMLLLNKAWKANPVGLIISSLLVAIALYKSFRAVVGKAEKETLEFNKEVGVEHAKLEILFGSLKNAEKGTREWTSAKQQLNKEHARSLGFIIDENTTIEALNRSLDSLKKTVRSLIAERRMLNEINAIADKISVSETGAIKLLEVGMEGLSNTVQGRTSRAFLDLADKLSKLTKEEADAELNGQALNKVLKGTFIDTENAKSIIKILVLEMKAWGIAIDNIKAKYEGFISEDDTNLIKRLGREINLASDHFTVFYKLQTEEQRKSFAEKSKFMSDDIKTTEQYLDSLLDLHAGNIAVTTFIRKEKEKISIKIFKKGLDERKEAFIEFNKTTGEQEREFYKNKFDFITNDTQTYKAYLEELLKDRSLHVAKRAIIQQELFDIENKGGVGRKGKDDRLAIAKARNKEELAEKKRALEEQLSADIIAKIKAGESEEEINAFIESETERHNLILLNLELDLNKKLIDVKGISEKQIAQIDAESKNLAAQIATEITDQKISELWRVYRAKKRIAKLEQKEIENEKAIGIQSEVDRASGEILALNEQLATGRISRAKYAEDILKIEDKLALNALAINLKKEKEKLDIENLSVEDKLRINNKITEIEIAQSEKEVEIDTRKAEKKREIREETFRLAMELTNEVFNAFITALDDQLAAAQEARDFEVALAGSNTEERIKAERKFEKESLKIRRKQAIAQKAQAAFDVITNTAVAITKILGTFGGIFLVPLIAAIGAVKLATILSTPIPKFAEGTDDFKGGLAILGDKKGDKTLTKSGGVELITPPGKQSYLSPMFPTIMDLPSGTHVTPHDATQKILAEGAMQSAYESVDMGKSERYLKDIRDKGSTIYENGFKIKTRKNFRGKYRCS